MTGLVFLSPWVLGALALLPALWWLLRVLPPKPREAKFPPLFLLAGLAGEVRTPARAPWWILLLRTALALALILAYAEPVLRKGESLPGGGPVLLAVDTGWAAAAHWEKRRDKLLDLAARAGRAGRAVVLLPTAPAPDGTPPKAFGPLPAEEAAARIEALTPQPWPADYAAAKAEAERALTDARPGHAVFLSDGLADAGLAEFLETLARMGKLVIVSDGAVNAPRILRRAQGPFSFSAERLAPGGAEAFSLAASDSAGGALDTAEGKFTAGETRGTVDWNLPAALRGEAARIALSGPLMASSAFLTDSRWQRKPVGILADSARKENSSLLNEVYYLRRALEGDGPVAADTADALLAAKLSVIVWPDGAQVTAAERDALAAWVQDGGFLLRFAGPGLAANPDDALLPVRLRHGERAMEGALTWGKPARLGGYPDGSPLAGEPVPEDVTVARQVLAEPTPETFSATWLQLEDGTPLVTGAAQGRGAVALVHTTAGPEWSNFCYSGLYVGMLRRMVSLSAGIAGYKAKAVLPPLMVMDAFGNLAPPKPDAAAAALDSSTEFTPSPKTPPGLYGDRRDFRVFNLGQNLPALRPLGKAPSGAELETYAPAGEKPFRPALLTLAALLLLADTLCTLALRGLLALPRGAAAAVLLSLLLVSAAARAETDPSASDPSASDPSASDIVLAYVETGDEDTDRISQEGLEGLAFALKTRTTIEVKAVRGVNPAEDKLYLYPILYWPMSEGLPALSSDAARALRDYMGQGGMILFDTRDAQFGQSRELTPGARRLREISRSLDIPELKKVDGDHILTRSFYLLKDFPGRFAGGNLWAEREPGPGFDGVTSVVIAPGDFAAAWARRPSDRARFPVSPGGERQREMAYRAGINIVMAALAGSYKADQVHIPYILERLGQ